MIAGHQDLATLHALVRPGLTIVVPRGTPLRTTHPSGGPRTATRTRRVTLHHLLPGQDSRRDAYALRKGHSLFANPAAVWAGRGGYWVEADLNDIATPDDPRPLGERHSLGSWIATHEMGDIRVLYAGPDVLAVTDQAGTDPVRFAFDDPALVAAQRAFFALPEGDADHDRRFAEIPLRTSAALSGWLMEHLYARPAREHARRTATSNTPRP